MYNHFSNMARGSYNISNAQQLQPLYMPNHHRHHHHVQQQHHAQQEQPQHHAHQLQEWYIPNKDLAFVHIGKAGGTSFESWMGRNGRPNAVGNGIHADMSYIDAHVEGHPHILGFLREPAARAASNILFWNTLGYTKDWKGRDMSLSQILNDPETLKMYSGAYQDGWGGVCWLAGLCPNGWYVHTNPDGNNETELKRRHDTVHSNPELAVSLAKEQLERFAWFGLLGQKDESTDMLAWQMDLNYSAPGLPRQNANDFRKAVTKQDLQQLRKLLPMDVSLYKYAKKLFEQRLRAYKAEKAAGRNAKEAIAPFPHLNPDEQDNAQFVRRTSDVYSEDLLPMDALISDFASGDDY